MTSPRRILILFAHPAIKRSKVNAALRAAVEGLPDITIHDLYAAYPDFLIDVPREQALCLAHDIIILQHPLYWYSTPAIAKEWLDLVLEHGWAYGHTGSALAGKIFFQVLTAGGDAQAYSHQGSNRHTIGELTLPLRATAHLCRMRWLPPYAVLGVHRGLPPQALQRHATDYRRTLEALRDDQLDLESLGRQELLNSKHTAISGEV